jgi:hypothetical protein
MSVEALQIVNFALATFAVIAALSDRPTRRTAQAKRPPLLTPPSLLVQRKPVALPQFVSRN